MAVIYITEQGSSIRKKERRLSVVKGKETLYEVPVFQVERILVFGNVQISSQALGMLLEQGIDICFMTTHYRYKGKISSMMSKNIFLRLAQHACWQDRSRRLKLAANIVKGKINNMRLSIMRYRRNHPDMPAEKWLKTLERGMEMTGTCQRLDELMGIEGFSSAAYFSAYAYMIRGDFEFAGRKRRPAPDPVNALLSLGYTLLTAEMGSLLEAMSFDPYLGFLHGIKYGRKSLALDMIEEFRVPVVDRFIQYVVNNQMFKPGDFLQRNDGGIVLRDDPFKRYLAEYEKRMASEFVLDGKKTTWRKILARQVQNMERAVMQNTEYVSIESR